LQRGQDGYAPWPCSQALLPPQYLSTNIEPLHFEDCMKASVDIFYPVMVKQS
jgi:hypothetical protein